MSRQYGLFPSRAAQYDQNEAEQRKIDGIELTAANNAAWLDDVISLARVHLPHGEFMGEDVRRVLAPLAGEPNNPGAAWGAAVRRLLELNILHRTGRYRTSRAIKNNGHKYEVYVRRNGPPQ